MSQSHVGQGRSEERYRVNVARDVRIPMRDGTLLAMDVYVPDAPGPFPTLLERTPYDKRASMEVLVDAPTYFASRGYAVVIQDNRGYFASDGTSGSLTDDGWGLRQDGYDTVESLAQFPWCNGRIGTIGGSATGATQYVLAPTRPPHLAAQFVREGAGQFHKFGVYRGGVLELSLMVHVTLTEARRRLSRLGLEADNGQVLAAIDADLARLDDTCRRRPVIPLLPSDFPEVAWPGCYDWWRHSPGDEYWLLFDALAQADQVDAPIVHFGGWYDLFLEVTTGMFGAIRECGRPRARPNQRLVVGPWIHGPQHIDKHVFGEVDFGPRAVANYNALRLPWLDRWLKDVPMEDEPIVRFCTMGSNVWQDATDWPPPDTTTFNLYLGPGPAHSTHSLNDGILDSQLPVDAGVDCYRHDPDDPIPTMGGNWLPQPNGPTDHRAVEPRLLTYTSPVLAANLEVTGQPTVELYASSSAVDTDFIVHLCDVYPDGRAMLIDEGLIRARFRHSFTAPELLTPGRVERYEIPLSPTSIVLPAGHRLRLHVTSSSFPRWHPNTGTAESSWLAATALAADNAVYRGPGHPSVLRVPIRSALRFAAD